MHKIKLQAAAGGKDVGRVHMIGIGGVSMSGLAEILINDGYTVSGSDAVSSGATEHLRALGINIVIGNHAENITRDTDLVVYTAAVRKENPEYQAAAEYGLPIIDRAKLLGFILDGYPYSVCISGSHGKTSTTALISDICLSAGLDPSISLGGYMGEGYNFRIGQSPYFIMEACEYFDSFLQWRPRIGCILNIDNDHMDYFGTMDRLVDSFRQFALNIPPDGDLVIYGGIPYINRITEGLACRIITYGTDNAEYASANITYDAMGCASVDVLRNGRRLTRITLRQPGAHIALNALAAYAVCDCLGLDAGKIARGFTETRGVKRRFEYKGTFNGAAVVDDYAHHPSEIRPNLASARAGQAKRIICAFQPHTYSRTENLLEEFAASFTDTDLVVLLPIFASREAYHPAPGSSGVSSERLAERIREHGQNAQAFNSFDEAEAFLRNELMQGDMLITMGAGDVNILGERLLRTELLTLSTDA